MADWMCARAKLVFLVSDAELQLFPPLPVSSSFLIFLELSYDFILNVRLPLVSWHCICRGLEEMVSSVKVRSTGWSSSIRIDSIRKTLFHRGFFDFDWGRTSPTHPKNEAPFELSNTCALVTMGSVHTCLRIQTENKYSYIVHLLKSLFHSVTDASFILTHIPSCHRRVRCESVQVWTKANLRR